MAGEDKGPDGTEARRVGQAPEPMPVAESPAREVRGPGLGARARHGIRANRWAEWC